MIAMNPTSIDTAATSSCGIGDWLQGPAESDVQFADLLFSVEAEQVPPQESDQSDENGASDTESVPATFFIPAQPQLQPLGLKVGEVTGSSFDDANYGALEQVLPDPTQPAELPFVPSGGVKPQVSEMATSTKMPEIPEGPRAVIDVIASPQPGRIELSLHFNDVRSRFPIGSVARPDVSSSPTSPLNADSESSSTVAVETSTIIPRKPIDVFWSSAKEPKSAGPEKGSPFELNEILAAKVDVSSRTDEIAPENAELTDAILGRFEAKRSTEVEIGRPESRLPAEIRAVDQVSDQLITFIPTHLAKEGKDILKMRLHPAELGHVEIEIERDSSGTITAKIRTETESAQHILIEGLNELRDSLRESGIDVGVVEVTTSAASSGEQDGRDHGSRQTRTSEFAESAFAPTELDHEAVDNDRLVSLRA
jgi:hypothetical protein